MIAKLEALLQNRVMLIASFIFAFLLLLYMVSPSLNVLDTQTMFNFQDETQPGRITSFVTNLQAGKIPPRMAPEYSFKLGFPLFNFYAPFAYWVGGIIHFIGVPLIPTLKIDFLLAIVISFFTMYFFLKQFFNWQASLFGTVMYVSSTYFATETVVRGDLAETWFLALFPLALMMLLKNSKSHSRLIFILSAIIFSFVFTTHNIFSLMAVGVLSLYALLLENKIRNFAAIFLGLLLGAYFLIPAVLELHLTQAAATAKLFNYKDHFLCLWQLWTANGWEFFGSFPGCDADRMSFKIGKIQEVIAGLGVLLLLINSIKNKKIEWLHIFVLALGVVSLFLTLYASAFIWKIFEPILALFQFPWRFILFGTFATAYFGAYLVHSIKLPLKLLLLIPIIFVVFFTGKKYFIKPMLPKDQFLENYNSQGYREAIIAYNVKEYLPQLADFAYWHDLNPLETAHQEKLTFDYHLPVDTKSILKIEESGYFDKKIDLLTPGKVFINIHYFPYWQIKVNDKEVIPTSFDKLGRPLLHLNKPSTIFIHYRQSLIEQLGNLITIVSIGFLILIGMNKRFLRKII